jgi:hypothetical protein
MAAGLVLSHANPWLFACVQPVYCIIVGCSTATAMSTIWSSLAELMVDVMLSALQNVMKYCIF